MNYSYYSALRWFKTTVALGFALNLLFILPALFAPRLLESLIEVGITNTVHWLQNVALLLLIITLSYIPVYQDPFRYEFLTVLIIAGRFGAGTLFLLGVGEMNYPEGMKLLGMTDIGLSSLQAFLWYRAMRDGDPRVAEGTR